MAPLRSPKASYWLVSSPRLNCWNSEAEPRRNSNNNYIYLWPSLDNTWPVTKLVPLLLHPIQRESNWFYPKFWLTKEGRVNSALSFYCKYINYQRGKQYIKRREKKVICIDTAPLTELSDTIFSPKGCQIFFLTGNVALSLLNSFN